MEIQVLLEYVFIRVDFLHLCLNVKAILQYTDFKIKHILKDGEIGTMKYIFSILEHFLLQD